MQPVYHNPTPVSVVLIPVEQEGHVIGLVGLKRNIEPGLGKLAMPGGFVEEGESSEEAGAREVVEEIGLLIQSPQLSHSHVTPNGKILLLFHVTQPISTHKLAEVARALEKAGNHETQSVELIRPDTPSSAWAFPLHYQSAVRFFQQQGLSQDLASSVPSSPKRSSP